MGIFRREPIDEMNRNPIPKAEEEPEKELEDEETICVNCKHHKEEDGDHKCYANATEEIDYVTGDRKWVDVEDCEDVNEEGDCEDYEKKI